LFEDITKDRRQDDKKEQIMTHIETARVNEMLGLQIAVIKDIVHNIDGDDLGKLDNDLSDLEAAILKLRAMMVSLPHRHLA